MFNGHFTHVTPEHKNGKHASMPSAKNKALDITPKEDIPKGEITAQFFSMHMSIAEKTWCHPKQRDIYLE